MNITLEIEFADGTKKAVTAQAADLVAFEQKFDLSIARLEKDVRLTHLLFIAWNVERRTKTTELDFEAWTETVASVGTTEAKK